MGEFDPQNDPGYQEWLGKTAKECRCCPQCCDRPCGACMAGGICDARRCRCDGYDGLDDMDREEEWHG